MLDILHIVGSFVLAISILVGIHEYGHYWMAKRCGVKVLCFSIGFGRQLFSWTRGETQFKIALIPVGGYVKMLDEREGPVPDSERHMAFNHKPVWARAAIVVAGPLSNFLFAILAYTAVFMIGITGFPAVLGPVAPGSAAAHAGLYEHLEIIELDKRPVATWEEVVVGTINRVGDKGTIEIKAVEKNDQQTPKTFHIDLKNWQPKDSENPVTLLGLKLSFPPIPAIIGEVQPGSVAEAAGILQGDQVLVADGKKIEQWEDFLFAIRDNPDKSIRLTLLRQGKEIGVDVTPKRMGADTVKEAKDNTKQAISGHGFIGVSVLQSVIPSDSLKLIRYNPLDAFTHAVQKTWRYSVSTLVMIKKMVVGDLSPKQLSGPITIARYASDSFIFGLSHFLGFLALVSISLGVMNLLPIPVLDGGHLLYYLIEVLRGGRQLSEKNQQIGLQIGATMLLLLMCLAFYNDVLRML